MEVYLEYCHKKVRCVIIWLSKEKYNWIPCFFWISILKIYLDQEENNDVLYQDF